MKKFSILILIVVSVLQVKASFFSWTQFFLQNLQEENDPRCKENGIFSIPNDCTSYLICRNGRGRVKKCPDGSRFDSVYYCIEDEDADCGTPFAKESLSVPSNVQNDIGMCEMPPEKGPCHGTFLAYYYDIQTHTCQEFYYSGCGGNDNNFPDKESCMETCFLPEEYEMDTEEFSCEKNGRYANPHSCSSYIECSYFEENLVSRIVQCPPGEHYSDSTQKCEDKCIAKCDLTLEMCEPHPDFVCSRDGTYPYLGDCKSYHQCSRGIPIRRRCYEGLHYSKETRRCEMPCNAKCDPDLACECGWTSCENSSAPATVLPSEVNCTKNSFQPVTGDCTKFVVCAEGEIHQMSCPPGLHYNRDTARCETPCSARCDEFIPCFMEERLCNSGKCFECPHEDGVFSDLYDCSIYHKCEGNVSTILSCPPGKLFDHRTSRCVREDKALCVYLCEELNSMYKHPLDSKSYVLCQYGRPKVGKCQEGSVFEPQKKMCVELEMESHSNAIADLFQMQEYVWED